MGQEKKIVLQNLGRKVVSREYNHKLSHFTCVKGAEGIEVFMFKQAFFNTYSLPLHRRLWLIPALTSWNSRRSETLVATAMTKLATQYISPFRPYRLHSRYVTSVWRDGSNCRRHAVMHEFHDQDLVRLKTEDLIKQVFRGDNVSLFGILRHAIIDSVSKPETSSVLRLA